METNSTNVGETHDSWAAFALTAVIGVRARWLGPVALGPGKVLEVFEWGEGLFLEPSSAASFTAFPCLVWSRVISFSFCQVDSSPQKSTWKMWAGLLSKLFPQENKRSLEKSKFLFVFYSVSHLFLLHPSLCPIFRNSVPCSLIVQLVNISKPHAKCFAHFILHSPHHLLWKWAPFIPSLFRWGNRGKEKFNGLLRSKSQWVTELRF